MKNVLLSAVLFAALGTYSAEAATSENGKKNKDSKAVAEVIMPRPMDEIRVKGKLKSHTITNGVHDIECSGKRGNCITFVVGGALTFPDLNNMTVSGTVLSYVQSPPVIVNNEEIVKVKVVVQSVH